MTRFDAQAGVGHRAPLALQLLALLGREGSQEVGEVAVAAIEPVELHAAPQEQPGGFERRAVGLAHEQALPVGSARCGGDFDGGGDQRGTRFGFVSGNQQARPRRRREGDAADKLGEIVQAGLLPGGSPTVVHGEIAVPVMPLIQGQQTGDTSVASAQREMHRLPALRTARGDALFGRAKKGTADEGIARRDESLPVGLGNIECAGEQHGFKHVRWHSGDMRSCPHYHAAQRTFTLRRA